MPAPKGNKHAAKSNAKTPITIRLDPRAIRAISELAQDWDVSKAELFDTAILEYLDREYPNWAN